MNFSNKYIFIYATAMVVIVATLLSFTAITLRPVQQKNIAIEKKQDILASVGLSASPENAEKMFDKYIRDSYVIDHQGEKKQNIEAFQVDMAKEIRKPVDERNLPVYECTLDNGSHAYILPVRGKGLWGPIWGYVAVKEDFNTLYGVTFDHKAETPGLGAEINTDNFENQFANKKLFDKAGNFTSITVYKGGAEAAGDLKHGVDAISGGTITSKGLENMLDESIGGYKAFLNNKGI